MLWRGGGLVAFGLVIANGAAAPAWGAAGGNSNSLRPAIAAGGRIVAFWSCADNLVPGDTNGIADVFVRDRRTRTTERVSVGPGDIQANERSFFSAAISADGRFVAFLSGASNLVPGDTNDAGDIFVHDRRTHTTKRVSLGRDGAQANGQSLDNAISADGRLVAFRSDATNLVPGDTNGVEDVFVRDLRRGTTERVSVRRNGAQGNANSGSDVVISADGRFVAFLSSASNLVPGDTNGEVDTFVHDRRTHATERVSVGRNGAQANSNSYRPALSAHGRFVAFATFASNLVPGDTNNASDVFVRDRRTDTIERVSLGRDGAQANGQSSDNPISAHGRFVAFDSFATNLVPGGTNGERNIFVRDRRRGTTQLVSVGLHNAPPPPDC